MIRTLFVLIILSTSLIASNCINFRTNDAADKFEQFDTVTGVMQKYLKITRCNPDRTPSNMFAVYPIQDGSHICEGYEDNCLMLAGNKNIEEETYQLFSLVNSKKICTENYEMEIVHDVVEVSFDWYSTDTEGFSVNGTVNKYSFHYYALCADIPPGTGDVEFYSAAILDNIPEVPAGGWTDYYYRMSSTLIGENETICSDPTSKPSGLVNIPLGVCLRDPAGWMNAVAYYGLHEFFSSKYKTASTNKYKKTGEVPKDTGLGSIPKKVNDNSKTISKSQIFNKRKLQDQSVEITGQPNIIEIQGNGKGYKTGVLNFRYLPQIGTPKSCGVKIHYFEPDDKKCHKVLKKAIKNVEDNQCMEVLGNTATSEIYTFGAGDYIRSVAPYDAIDNCLASFNDGYNPDVPVNMLSGGCDVVTWASWFNSWLFGPFSGV